MPWLIGRIAGFLIMLGVSFFVLNGHAASTANLKGASRIQSRAPVEGLRLRSNRKLGLGTQVSGPLGLASLKAEVNLSSLFSVSAGAGMGPGYQTFGFELKRMIGGDAFVPFVAAGFARWYSILREGQSLSRSNPNFFSERFLSDEEKNSGEFARSFIYPSAGIQYHQLRGPWSGASVYMQLLMLMDIQRMNSAPTGALGFMYYF